MTRGRGSRKDLPSAEAGDEFEMIRLPAQSIPLISFALTGGLSDGLVLLVAHRLTFVSFTLLALNMALA